MKNLYLLVSVIALLSIHMALSAQNSLVLYSTALPADLGPKGKHLVSQSKVVNIPIIYHHEIDPGNTGRVDYALVSQAIETRIPGREEAGICILDWEGPQFEFLKHGKIDHDSMSAIVSKFIELLAFARKMRPRAKWGIYDMPVSTYWVNQDSTWPQRSEIIFPLLRQTDVFCPSLYDYFKTGSYGWMDDEAYIRVTLERNLALAKQLNKPVIPFVWHRYHDATEVVGLKCIDPDEFSNQIAQMLTTNYSNTRISGLVWWHEDGYYYSSGDKRVLEEAAGKSKNDYLDDVIPKYLAILTDLIKKNQTPQQ